MTADDSGMTAEEAGLARAMFAAEVAADLARPCGPIGERPPPVPYIEIIATIEVTPPPVTVAGLRVALAAGGFEVRGQPPPLGQRLESAVYVWAQSAAQIEVRAAVADNGSFTRHLHAVMADHGLTLVPFRSSNRWKWSECSTWRRGGCWL